MNDKVLTESSCYIHSFFTLYVLQQTTDVCVCVFFFSFFSRFSFLFIIYYSAISRKSEYKRYVLVLFRYVHSPLSSIRTDSASRGTNSLLTTNPGVSLHVIVVFPRAFPHAIIFSYVSSEVSGMRITFEMKTSFINWH